MRLVEATAADLDTLVELWYDLAVEMEAYDELNDLVYTEPDEVPDDWFRDNLDSETNTDYLVVHDGETIGFCSLAENDHAAWSDAGRLRIVNLYVEEGVRGQGHGTAVVERVREIARERGCDLLEVSCEWDNDGARRFYRDSGFRPKQVDFVQSVE
ncbi:N-acetyltransferase family protein [Halobaculum sp. MBLA0143]|uniref:GNAT family N-acetyltransferase n=1 Tax=Halobaculum sp. MBLA0143 TaxID=3079933 RepID=UPI003523DDCD